MDTFESISDKVMNLFDNIGWVRWIHEGTTPAYAQQDKELNLVYGAISKHCAICMNLNGCCFPKNKTPERPLHPKCHCKVESISEILAVAECSLTKFENYIFDPISNSGKKALFESWGYSIIDSQWLQSEFERQGKEKYESGNFILNKLDGYGQRIDIVIELPRKDRAGTVKFISGWMVYPDGRIQLATPMGG